MDSTLKEYKEDLDSDLEYDELSINDFQSKLPAIKHKWVFRLIQHKDKLLQAKSKRVELIKKEHSTHSPVNLSTRTIENMQSDDENVLKVDDFIKNQELIIDYLEKVEKIVSSCTFDVKNLIEYMKLEM